MANTVFGVLEDKIKALRVPLEESLTQGAAKDFAEYKDRCGIIQGLNLALREIEDLSKNYMDDDNE
jgi:hypothetical protein